MRREKLPNCRLAETYALEHDGIRYAMTVGRYDDGRVAEVFVDCEKVTSAYDFLARDAAMVMSIALQYATPFDAWRKAVIRDANGAPLSLIGRVLDELKE